MAPEGWQDYQPGMIESLLAEGKTVFVDYSASWCSTCKAQERAITAIRADSDAYEAMSYVRVDWDEYGRHAVTTSRKIPRRSTLLVLPRRRRARPHSRRNPAGRYHGPNGFGGLAYGPKLLENNETSGVLT